MHDDHADDDDTGTLGGAGEAGQRPGGNPDGSHDQDADPPTPLGEEPHPEDSDVEDPDPEPGSPG